MTLPNQQQNNITEEEIEQVIHYFELLGYKRNEHTIPKLIKLANDCPDKDLVKCANEMYEWFSEASERGRKIKSYHLTFRNWTKKDYAPKKTKPTDFFKRTDLY